MLLSQHFVKDKLSLGMILCIRKQLEVKDLLS